MKRVIAALLIGALPAAATAAETDALAAEARGIIQGFAGELKGELQGAMKSGGPGKAIEVCNQVAPAIAEAHSERSGWQVGRTSLKLRNPANAPDAWETRVMEAFEARKAHGEAPAAIDHFAVVERDGGKVFRYMKAIPTEAVCTKCHGGELAAPVAAKLDGLYPQDQARGYREGDLRGAFTLEKRL
jgi:hypothetical protein